MKNIKSFILANIFMLALVGSAFSQTQNDSTKTITLKVKGINCHMDVKTIADNVQKLKGVYSCIAEKPGATTTFTVKYNTAQVSEQKIHAEIENTAGCDDPNEKPYKIKK